MAYTSIDTTKPDPTSQNITAFAQSVRDNVEGLLDLLVGAMSIGAPIIGWTMAVSTGTYALPTQLTYSKYGDTQKKVRVNITYDGSNRRSTVNLQKTSNGGTNWDYVAFNGGTKLTWAYDGATTNVVSITAGTV